MSTLNLDIPLGASLTEEEARAICAQGEEAIVFALLTMAQMLAQQQAQAAATSHQAPSTPSGMKPPYQKPPAPTRGRKKPRRKKGHLGSRREKPERIDRRVEHRAQACPDCGGELKRCAQTRYTEDIPENLEAEVTEHTIHRDWCPHCKKKVEPAVTEAMPNATLGNLAERSIHPAVILRKNSNGNRSPKGAQTQAILISVFFTLKKRGHNPVAAIRNALTVYLETGQLPPLPENTAAND